MAAADATRTEKDTMGPVRIPSWAYWGAQTQRAVENFGVSARRIPPRLIRALGLIKGFAAETNAELGLLEDGATEQQVLSIPGNGLLHQ